MHKPGRWILALWLVMASVAYAGERVVVVELFTSQGCSSCPPADAFFHSDLAPRSDVIALALHVDYWDYIGWKDKFANPAYAKRQKKYARAAGHRSVYTPQMIVAGRDHVVGHHPEKLRAALARHLARDPVVEMALDRAGDQVTIRARARQATGPLVVQLVRYKPVEDVAIRRGENAGKTITYANIVADWQVVGTWDGRAELTLSAPAPGPMPVVAIVQQAGHGQILGAARVP